MNRCPLCKQECKDDFLFTKRSFFYAGIEYCTPVFYVMVLRKLCSANEEPINHTSFRHSPTHLHQAIRQLRSIFLDSRIPYSILNIYKEGYVLHKKG